VLHRVPFHETDGMRIVHHANYVHWFELARLDWMDEHHVAYSDYVALGLNYATTRIEIDYHAPARFDDRVQIEAWLDDLGGASLGMSYRARREDTVLVSGRTEHACVDEDGRVRRIPKDWRNELRAKFGAGLRV